VGKVVQVRVLVTGAAGFIGRKLCGRFRAGGDEVIMLDKEPLVSDIAILCDIRDDERMGALPTILGRVDACVHLAAIAAPRQAEADPQLAWETNVRGTHNVLALCRRVGISKVVFASSAHVYGISPRYMPTDEGHPLALLDTYTTTKILGEELCQLFYDNYDISYTTCRLFNAYGPGQSPDYFMGKKLSQAISGGPVTIMNGGVTKDWVWVFDVVEALFLATRTPYVGPLNIGTGVETSLREIADQIAEAFAMSVVPDAGQDIGPTRMCSDSKRAERVLGWRPEVSFASGLARTIADARNGRVV
jgi:UDP-glucose 4-epimerase